MTDTVSYGYGCRVVVNIMMRANEVRLVGTCRRKVAKVFRIRGGLLPLVVRFRVYLEVRNQFKCVVLF